MTLQARIVQRGAVPPLITMLGQTDVQLKEMGAFALGRLAQNADNQAGIVQVRTATQPLWPNQLLPTHWLLQLRRAFHISSPRAGRASYLTFVEHTLSRTLSRMDAALPACCLIPSWRVGSSGTTFASSHIVTARLTRVRTASQSGGLPPLLDLLDSRNGNLQHNAAFALYGLADNEDNIGDMVREGAVQRLQACDLIAQVSPSPHNTTFTRLFLAIWRGTLTAAALPLVVCKDGRL